MDFLKGHNANFILTSQLGRKGKFGGVWRGTTDDGRPVSVKCMSRYHPDLPQLLGRLAGVRHECVSPVIDSFVADDGQLYVVRPFYEGTDLKTIFTDKDLYRKVDERKFLDAGRAILEGLSAVHACGIVHRDIKPSNIVVVHPPEVAPQDADFGRLKIIDFEQCGAYPDHSGVRAPFSLIYSPPEALLKYNQLIGPWSDLFALSVTLFQLIMGKAPYTDCNPEVLINLQLTYPMKQPARMDDALFAVLSKAAYKQRFPLPPRRMTPAAIEQTLRQGVEGRYATAAEMLDDLRRVDRTFKEVGWFTRVFGQ